MNDKNSSCHQPKAPWYLKPLVIVSLITIALLMLSVFISFLKPFQISFIEYAQMVTFPILLGFFLGGMIDRFVPKEYVSKVLGSKKKRTVVYAVALGFLMSACSHGILALSMQLHKKGAAGSSVVAFLLASPWANLAITVLLVGFFGLKAFLIILSALLIALSTGIFFQFLESKNKIEINKNVLEIETHFSIFEDVKRRFEEYRWGWGQFKLDCIGVGRGIFSLMEMVLWWILIGMVLASLISAYMPHDIFQRFLAPNGMGLLITLLAATVIEVCSEGSAPLAFEIFRQTGAFGNAFVFLMGGVVTDYTEIGLVWTNLGKKTALWMIVATLPQVLFMGFLLNLIRS